MLVGTCTDLLWFDKVTLLQKKKKQNKTKQNNVTHRGNCKKCSVTHMCCLVYMHTASQKGQILE